MAFRIVSNVLKSDPNQILNGARFLSNISCGTSSFSHRNSQENASGSKRLLDSAYNSVSDQIRTQGRGVHDYKVDKPWVLDDSRPQSFGSHLPDHRPKRPPIHRFSAFSPEKLQYYNDVIYPPNHTIDGKPVTGCVFHYREGIKHSPRKMFLVCHLVRGLSVEEALKQCDHLHRKGGAILAELIREAIVKAREEHNIEFPTNLWLTDAHAKQCFAVSGLRKHARAGNYGTVKYRFCNLYIRLEEGRPDPYDGARFRPRTGWEKMEEYVEYLRGRKIKYSL